MGMKKRVILNMIKGLLAQIVIVLVTIIIFVVVYHALNKERGDAEPIKTQPEVLPTVTGIEPNSGPMAGGTPVTITGKNFQNRTTITISGQEASNVVFHSPTQLTAKTPPGVTGPADVTVTNPGEKPATLKAGFTYIPAPTVTAIIPPKGSTEGGTPITVVGTNFKTDATVEIGGQAATDVNVVSDTKLFATTPPGTAGLADVVVRNPDGQIGMLPKGFTYNLSPFVKSIIPNSGPVVGGTLVTIRGKNFVSGATVTIGGNLLTDVAFISDQKIQAKTPAGRADATDVVVTNPDGQIGTLPKGFTYNPPPIEGKPLPESDPYWTLTFKDVDEQAGDSITVSWIGKEKEPTIRKEGQRWEFEIPVDVRRVTVRWTKGGKQGEDEFANNLGDRYNTYYLQRLAGSAQSTEQKSP
ncbi:IPT/TIG domain-containing protein [Candidatus Poribacteria bacterium]|nr:IPT/TIG domain-containing protein [Candidatus Poribacteria bacterium]